MTASSKTPTASGISRLLAKAGFRRGVTAMRGGTSGYVVTAWGPGDVRVRYHSLTMLSTAERRYEMLHQYAEVLEAAGYAVTTGTSGHLLVAAKATPPETP